MNKSDVPYADVKMAYEAFDYSRELTIEFLFGNKIPQKEEMRINQLLETNAIFKDLFNGMKITAEENNLTSVEMFKNFTKISNDKFVAKFSKSESSVTASITDPVIPISANEEIEDSSEVARRKKFISMA